MPTLTLMKRRCHGQKYEGETFSGLDLSNMLAFGSTWNSILFKGCDLSQADFTTAKLYDSHFYDCDLPLARFNAAEMRHVVFENCRAKSASFAGVTPMNDVRFLDCALHYSSFLETTAKEVRFVGSNLHGADLRFIDGGASVVYDNTVLWNATVQLGCQFFSAAHDERSSDLFTAMVARRHPNADKAARLAELAGGQMAVVDRLMNDRAAAEKLEDLELPQLKEVLKGVKIDPDAKTWEGEFPGC